MPRIDAVFKAIKLGGASDLHISAGSRPMLRVNGEIEPIEQEELTSEVANALLLELLTDDQRRQFEERHYIDFSYDLAGVARFRCNYFIQAKGIAGAFRVLPSTILPIEQLGLPKRVVDFCTFPKGLVIVTGPPGSGKSTTLAALIDHVNETQPRHVLTIEDPIEFMFENKRCLVHQREVGVHANSYADALRAALREDTNIIMIGEIRDLDTMSLAITAAQTGQLVFATLHTPSAAQAVDRIIDSFAGEREQQVRAMLADSLKGVIAQRLLKRKDGHGRVPAVEILIANTAVAALIRDGKTYQMPGVMQTARAIGMQLMDDHLVELVGNGVVAPEEAMRAVTNVGSMKKRLGMERLGDDPVTARPPGRRPDTIAMRRPVQLSSGRQAA